MRVRTLDRDKKHIKKRKPYECVCEVCGESFFNHIPYTKICKKDDCQRKHAKKLRDERKLRLRGELGYSRKKCLVCGNEFKPNLSTGKYCSDECRIFALRKTKNTLQKKYYERDKKNPKNIFIKSLRKWIERCILGKKAKKSIMYVEYTPEEFISNIESKFQDGMSWDNYGKWHIDHIRPLCSFSFVNSDGSVNIEEIKRANSLENLQPLWAIENLRKNKRWSNEG